ncbi:MAG: leucine--tRNA ligase [Candidatus Nealsonbacteria bacterium CG10_big_fil_rev_8_21_14_0_10_36_24]|uniref:Leucine--tRNA ligase n=2 Tax=Candidatus Nealsoniibacteriota TaxID=1817911 RepID=A0A2H0YP25_9BACT|nr:MAG: leucine--tRNA ligase [Candidatus Nealsonbacteria bacterium CG10_big_fil_rev_8_21_14_0_10_36_24]PIS40254.1 MAG: leucine--tRNA ligase [Candidatus Nealsonbacteria bacterium CG08_land_8_20_14_0_20_36_22]
MENYNPKKLERKWQGIWEKEDVFQAKNKSKKLKFYVLVEFPYPSGEGLHVGHCRSYIGLDVVARKRRMEGFNVLFPMGWDAFGLPTENYAIKTGIHPKIATRKNTAYFKRQQKGLGLSFDWFREINTTDPAYYKWTQWIFLQLFKNGLAYKAKIPINWCPACKIGLANEEVVDAKCERCGAGVVRKEKEQWLLKITNYAERLIQDLDLVDYSERVKVSQNEWIGKSEGTEIEFRIMNQELRITVFTTRPDTLFGCTYLVLAPEHPIIENLKSQISNFKFVEQYIKESKKKIEKERISEAEEKTGIELKGIKAINPVNGREIPIFVADYVLMQYGTGAIMAVPAHDQRDFDFAKKYNLAIIEVIKPKNFEHNFSEGAYEGEGILVNSRRFEGMKSEDARERIGEWLARQNVAEKVVHYKLRDWIFSRQRYWGEPIPLVFCENCAVKIKNQRAKIKNNEFSIGELQNPGWIAVPEKDLPVKLPLVGDYKPTEKGESPLAKIKNWVNTKCPKCKGPAERETDVMPNWAGSNWYYLAYTMPRIQKSKSKNQKYIWDKNKIKYWLPVDWYNGGMEHTNLHLLYSRFIYKFLWDVGAVPKEIGPEPYKKRTSHGMILGEGGIKMSKSKGNVINPETVVKEYGADTMRVYEMFMGPFEQMIPWDTKGAIGAKRFLEKVWRLQNKVNQKSKRNKFRLRASKNQNLESLIHKTIKKVGEDIESLKLNTAVSSLMILTNELDKQKEIPLILYSYFLILLSPFAPHLTEELWFRVGFKGLCCQQKWPKYDSKLIKEEKITLIIQINGKVRDKIGVEADIPEDEAKKIALSQEKVLKWTKDKKIKKTIFIPRKLINFVI